MEKLHVHPDKGPFVDVSTGSLGQGLPIALGMALANRNKNVYCSMTDGEATEGSIWEALRIAYEQKITNLKVGINYNGYGAYSEINRKCLLDRVNGFGWKVVFADGHNLTKLKNAFKKKYKTTPTVIFAETKVNQFAFLGGVDAHYYKMNDEDFQSAMKNLKS